VECPGEEFVCVQLSSVETTGRILVIEDDERIGGSLKRALEGNGYNTTWSATATEGEREFRLAQTVEERFDLVLLDLGLPDADGLDVCRRLVDLDPLVPVIMLTARDEELDLVIGLDAGAADYITKPFSLAPVLARIRAHLRRNINLHNINVNGTVDSTVNSNVDSNLKASSNVNVNVNGNESLSPQGEQSQDSDAQPALRIDSGARRVHLGGAEIVLRAKEFDLLVRLATDAGRVVTRETLMADVWDENWFGSTKTLDFHIAALRTKLDQQGEASRITTIRGVGFRFEG
jgi:DNA-binding response OmpR family regulator